MSGQSSYLFKNNISFLVFLNLKDLIFFFTFRKPIFYYVKNILIVYQERMIHYDVIMVKYS